MTRRVLCFLSDVAFWGFVLVVAFGPYESGLRAAASAAPAPTARPRESSDPAKVAEVAKRGYHTPDLSCRVRNARGEVVRSSTRRRLFMRMSGFPAGREGYLIDHIMPLVCGGCDVPSNMQWLSPEAKREKDKVALDCLDHRGEWH